MCNGHGSAHQRQQFVNHSPPRSAGWGMGPYTLYICAPSGIRPRETAGHPQLYLTHPDEGPSATSPGIQSKEGKTFPNSSWPHTENHHACHADGSNSQSPSPSTQCTIPPGTATTVPISDEHSSCVCPRQSRLVPDTGSKSPAYCDEIPTPVDYENAGGAAPYPSNASAWS